MPPKRQFALADFILIRTPLLPFQSMVEFGNGPWSSKGGGDDVEGGDLNARRIVLRQRLRRNLDDPVVLEGLWSASRSLHERIDSWEYEVDDRKAQKIQHALVKYYSRMAYRCTPYGLVAGFSWAPIALSQDRTESPKIQLSDRAKYRRHCRIDMSAVAALGAQLISVPEVRKTLSYFLNPTLYKRGASWHYIEVCGVDRERRFQLSAVEQSPHLDLLMRILEENLAPTSYEELQRVLKRAAIDVPFQQIDAFIDQLIENGVILSTLEPPLTGGSSFAHMLPALSDCPVYGVKTRISAVNKHLEAANKLAIGVNTKALTVLEGKISSLIGNASTTDVIQMDMQKPVEEMCFPRFLVDDICNAVELLLAISIPASQELNEFKAAFIDRYGTRAVSLTEALDPDHGLTAFGSLGRDDLPLLEGIPFNNSQSDRAAPEPPNSASELATRLFERACREQTDEITISESEAIELVQGDRATTPDSFCVVASLLDRTSGSSNQPSTYIRWADGSSAAQLLGRFCASDSELSSYTRRYLENEERNAERRAIYAELVHWSVDRLGNVILRPPLRKYELPLFGRPTVPKSAQVHLRDLTVSVVEGRILLRCRRTGQEVIPRLSSAHNTNRNSIALYRFLGAVRRQDARMIGFRWPATLRSASMLPRVVYGRCVISPKMWRLDDRTINAIRAVSRDESHSIIQVLRRNLRFPRFVELVEGDNTLCIDLDNVLSIDCLVNEIQHRKLVLLREAFVPSNNSFVRGPEGTYCHEIILPFLRVPTSESVTESPTTEFKVERQEAVQSTIRHIAGGEWLYLKLYTGTVAADRVLDEYIAPLFQRLLRHGQIQNWFFLRYHDPDHHLRVRCQGEPDQLWGNVVIQVEEALSRACEQSLIWKVELGSYEPELERYGGPKAMEVSEQIFHCDSEYVLALISLGLLKDSEMRWQLAVLGVDQFWSATGLNLPERAALYARRAGELGSRLGATRMSRLAIDRRFRSIRPLLDELSAGQSLKFEAGWNALETRTRALRVQLKRLFELQSQGNLVRPVELILSSQVHMFVNRICRSSNTEHEYVIYEILARHLRSQIARKKSLKSRGHL